MFTCIVMHVQSQNGTCMDSSPAPLIGGNLSNFLTAVTPRHPGRAGLSNCAKILPKKGEIVPKKGESRHRPFVRILLTDMCKFPKRHLVNVPPTFAKANQF